MESDPGGLSGISAVREDTCDPVTHLPSTNLPFAASEIENPDPVVPLPPPWLPPGRVDEIRRLVEEAFHSQHVKVAELIKDTICEQLRHFLEDFRSEVAQMAVSSPGIRTAGTWAHSARITTGQDRAFSTAVSRRNSRKEDGDPSEWMTRHIRGAPLDEGDVESDDDDYEDGSRSLGLFRLLRHKETQVHPHPHDSDTDEPQESSSKHHKTAGGSSAQPPIVVKDTSAGDGEEVMPVWKGPSGKSVDPEGLDERGIRTQSTGEGEGDGDGSEAPRRLLSKQKSKLERLRRFSGQHTGEDIEHFDVQASTSIAKVKSAHRHTRSLLTRVVKHPWFDYIVCGLITCNAVMIGVQTDLSARHPQQANSPGSGVFASFEVFFFIIFVAELGVRFYVWGVTKFFTAIGWRWNLFDFCVVGVQFGEVVAGASGNNTANTNITFVRVLRILRLIRVMRLFRILRLIRELRTLVNSIYSSMKALLWTCVLLGLMIYTVALPITHAVTEARIKGSEDQTLVLYYGTLPRTMESLYQSITGGVDWGDLVFPLESAISPYVGIMFVCYIAFAMLAMLNVVTGVFVESVLASAKVDRDLFMVNNARELFQSLDGGLRTDMTYDLFQSKLDSVPMREFFKAIDVDRSEAKCLFGLLDLDGSGSISVDEFLSGCLRLRGSARALDLVLLAREFRRFQGKMLSFASRAEHSLSVLQHADVYR